jgi:hypothetical protein
MTVGLVAAGNCEVTINGTSKDVDGWRSITES